ncbi:hypothetical protein Droror1_Dr00003220, partial [Drosera rotundifolia]
MEDQSNSTSTFDEEDRGKESVVDNNQSLPAKGSMPQGKGHSEAFPPPLLLLLLHSSPILAAAAAAVGHPPPPPLFSSRPATVVAPENLSAACQFSISPLCCPSLLHLTSPPPRPSSAYLTSLSHPNLKIPMAGQVDDVKEELEPLFDYTSVQPNILFMD